MTRRQAIKALQKMPRQHAQRFRLRVGDLRIIFERDDEARVMDVRLRIVPRGQAYKR